ncbi:MAG: type I glyceraldehyde-3-phosphate dehydrogenase [Myxococcota bacterium]|nr:type I glyceraldehyde-3-phosphate dehydrogenase [Myxococcota bacterium]
MTISRVGTTMIRIGINGLGRIGRACLQLSLNDPELEVVAANDLIPADNLAYLVKYDSVHGRCSREVSLSGNTLALGDHELRLLSTENPRRLPWGKLGVDVVIEGTGRFRSPRDGKRHLSAGAQHVVISANPTDDPSGKIPTVLRGVNDGDCVGATVVSAGSCSANAAAGTVKILSDRFGIESGSLTTVHAYTQDQRILETGHSADWRRGRAAACNIVPSRSEAALALSRLIPGLEGKLDGLAVRVPVPDGSLMEIVCTLRETTTCDEVNALLRGMADGEWAGILACSAEPLVSRDIVNDTHSLVVDSQLTSVSGGSMLRVVGWFDHEWGYAARVLEIAKRVSTFNS